MATSTLRYWEREFPGLAGERTKSGQRVYGPVQVALAQRIKLLLHDRGLTIEGARKELSGRAKAPATGVRAAYLEAVRAEVRALIDLVRGDD